MNMNFVDIDDPYLTPEHLLVKCLELFDKASSLFRVRFGQQLFALLPAQTSLRQDGAKCGSADRPADLFFYPSSQFFHGPVVAREFMLDWLTTLYGLNYLLDFFWAKRGRRPPLC